MSNLKCNRQLAAEQFLAAGCSVEEAAEALGLSPVTVRKYVDAEFAAEIAAKDRARRDAARADRANAVAEREAAVLQLFLDAAAEAGCQLPPQGLEDFDLIFSEWRKRNRRKARRDARSAKENGASRRR